MYASGSKTKDFNKLGLDIKNGRSNANVPRRIPSTAFGTNVAHSNRTAIGGTGTGSGIGNSTRTTTTTTTSQTHSRFTERKPTTMMAARGKTSTTTTQRLTATTDAKKKSTNNTGVILAKVTKETKINSDAQADICVKTVGAAPVGIEASIQTNEVEILNLNNIVGDMKVIMPSKQVVADIENQREETKKRQMLKAQRKFEVYAEKQEAHLTDLKEFLEKSVVTKRVRKPKITLELDKDLIHSMDEMINKGVPKAESITDIKDRIKRKEEELLGLFDNVERLKTVERNNTNSGI